MIRLSNTVSEVISAFKDCPETQKIVRQQVRLLQAEVKKAERMRYDYGYWPGSEEARQFLKQVVDYMYTGGRYSLEAKQLKWLKQYQRLCKGDGLIDIEKVKDVKIEDLYEFKKKRKTMRGFTALCPWHPDKQSSFSVRDNKWICFAGCGKGDVISFQMKLSGLSFVKAIRELSHPQQ